MLENVTAALIAGGKSKRFEDSKLFAEYRQKNLFDHALQKALSISTDTIIVGNIDPALDTKGIPVYKDLIEDCGPLCGIYTALSMTRKKYVAVLPVDMPLLSVEVYRILYLLCSPDKPVAALSHKGTEPLVSIWPVRALDEIEKSIHYGDYKLYKMLKSLDAREANLPHIMKNYNENWFTNINYKRDLESLILTGSYSENLELSKSY